MKTERPRHDKLTAHLLDLESELEVGLLNGATSNIIGKMRDEIGKLETVRTSPELDYLLQLTMLYISAHLAVQNGRSENYPFQITTSIYHPKYNRAVLVKPCFYGPGRCTLQHPTISLADSRGGDFGFDGKIGHSGLSMLHGQVLYCPRIGNGQCACCQYIQLQRGPQVRSLLSKAALCIPLKPGLRDEIMVFESRSEPSCQLGAHEFDCQTFNLADFLEKTRATPSLAVLNIECSTGHLTPSYSTQILRDEAVLSLLEKVTNHIEGYRQERGKYKAVRTCVSLFELAQHNLSKRETYRALLREISKICDGADVTLHLRDLRDKKDESRCVRLVAGTGRNFRGFLVNERYGLREGLIGSVLANGKTDYIDRRGIIKTMKGEDSRPFKQLMPRTILNLATPLSFHNLHFGVLNVEWDEVSLGGRDEELYIRDKMPTIERLASYLAAVVDFYEDQDNRDLSPHRIEDASERSAAIQREAARRQMMGYHVGSYMDYLDHFPQENFLERVINAVGYLVGFESDLRVMVSLRMNKDGKLNQLVDHGVPRSAPYIPLEIEVGSSVLGTCAALGIPLFGEVIERRFLKADGLCWHLIRDEEKSALKSTSMGKEECIGYIPYGQPEPVYEIAVPVVFGDKVLGTLDFELFAADESSRPSPFELETLRLRGHDLRGFLDWSRAIAFCLAYRDDVERVDEKSGFKESFSRFQRLCAQVIANVKVPAEMAAGLAAEYFHELIPFDHVKVIPLGGPGGINYETYAREWDSEGLPEAVELEEDGNISDLSFRGRPLGAMKLYSGGEKEGDSLCLFPDHRGGGPGGIVRRLMAAYYASTFLGVERSQKALINLADSLERVQELVLRERRNDFSAPELHAGQVIQRLFSILSESLAEEFGALAPKGERGGGMKQPGRYAWFLYLAHYDDASQGTFLRCGASWQRWATADTDDMRRCIERVRSCDNRDARELELRRLIQISGQEALAGELVERVGQFEVVELREVFIEMLSRMDHVYYGKDARPSFTRYIAESKKVQASIDFLMNPHRSSRNAGWFYERPYSIVGVPITLMGRVIGVLNILRVRANHDDFDFFKHEECEAAEKFGKAISHALASLIDAINLADVPAHQGVRELAGRRKLVDELRRMLSQGERLITVSCDFARYHAEIEVIREMCGSKDWRYPVEGEEWRSFLDRIKDHPVLMSSSDSLLQSQTLSVFRERLSEVFRSSACLVLLCEPSIQIADALPEAPKHLVYEESDEDLRTFLLSCLKGAAGNSTLLFRSYLDDRGAATIDHFARKLGGSASLIMRKIPIDVKEATRRRDVWRGFGDWIVYAPEAS